MSKPVGRIEVATYEHCDRMAPLLRHGDAAEMAALWDGDAASGAAEE